MTGQRYKRFEIHLNINFKDNFFQSRSEKMKNDMYVCVCVRACAYADARSRSHARAHAHMVIENMKYNIVDST